MSTAHAHFHTLPFHDQTTDPIDHEPVGEKGAVLEQGVGDRRDATASPIARDLQQDIPTKPARPCKKQSNALTDLKSPYGVPLSASTPKTAGQPEQGNC